MGKGGMPNLGGGNMQNLMKQAQKMQQDMMKTQEEMNEREFEATSGGGVVRVVVTGSKVVKSIEIKPEAVDPEDVEMLQDLVMAAVNEALRTATETVNAQMNRFTGGMNFGF